jgi:hypothetical protein
MNQETLQYEYHGSTITVKRLNKGGRNNYFYYINGERYPRGFRTQTNAACRAQIKVWTLDPNK